MWDIMSWRRRHHPITNCLVSWFQIDFSKPIQTAWRHTYASQRQACGGCMVDGRKLVFSVLLNSCKLVISVEEMLFVIFCKEMPLQWLELSSLIPRKCVQLSCFDYLRNPSSLEFIVLHINASFKDWLMREYYSTRASWPSTYRFMKWSF